MIWLQIVSRDDKCNETHELVKSEAIKRGLAIETLLQVYIGSDIILFYGVQ